MSAAFQNTNVNKEIGENNKYLTHIYKDNRQPSTKQDIMHKRLTCMN